MCLWRRKWWRRLEGSTWGLLGNESRSISSSGLWFLGVLTLWYFTELHSFLYVCYI